MATKESTHEVRKEQVDLIGTEVTTLVLSTGRKVNVGWTLPDTQDKINALIVEYEEFKKTHKEDEKDGLNSLEGNSYTRKFYSKVAAAIIIGSHSPFVNYFMLKLWFWAKWRIIHHFWRLSGDDLLAIVAECKKKAREDAYQLAMALAMDMTTLWTTMTKREAEEYRQELELVREHQSLKSSQPSETH